MLRKLLLLSAACLFLTKIYAQNSKGTQGEHFSKRVVIEKLSDPWEITYGPDDYLWVTESKSYRVSRINLADGKQTVILDLSENKNFPRYDKIDDEQDGGKSWPQGGLMGLALHPHLLQGKPYVYLAYIYQFAGANEEGAGCAENFGGCFFKTKVVRYQYDQQQQKLINPIVLCDTIPGSNDHNSGRLAIAPVAGKDYLFYTVGDLGAGQYSNAGRPNHAQQTEVYEGKVLRFNIETDGDANLYDQWIPNDNPFNNNRQNAVWSYGHRNAQGLAYAAIGGSGKLYSSEHGPFSDDEVNIIEKGRNYGHPLIIGYNDDNYNGLAAGATAHSELPGNWNTTYPLIKSEHKHAEEIGKHNFREPIYSFHPSDNRFLATVLKNMIRKEEKDPEWPSEAPSSIAVYTSETIPGWKNSLLVTALKGGQLLRLQLNKSGDSIVGAPEVYFKAPIRYRDIALSPDGSKIYLAVDSASVTSGPSGKDPEVSKYRGSILEFTYQKRVQGYHQRQDVGLTKKQFAE